MGLRLGVGRSRAELARGDVDDLLKDKQTRRAFF
jgi:hypothetical protein